MNLEKEMEKQMCAKKNVEIPAYHIALDVARQYAEEMCKKQKNLCAEEFFKKFNLDDSFVKGMNKIIDAPLATEEK